MSTGLAKRTDIDPWSTWVVSDTHFGHDNIKKFCHRPDNHDQLMIDEWVATIPDTESTVLHLGDLTYRNNDFFLDSVSPFLTGERKLLILGNHDHQRPSYYERAGFEIIEPFSMRFEATNVSFSHYPWEQHEGPLHGIHIHGHIHNNGYFMDRHVPYLKDHINVSIEVMKYRPVNLGYLLTGYLEGKKA